jgi:bifunctional non-homologous end joining protein LigD
VTRTVEVEVERRRLKLSNLEKVFYPKVGFTKGQVVDYYRRIAPAVLPHLRDRPLTLKRYPDGVEGQHFYEKQCPSHRPDWVRTAGIHSRRNKREIDFCVADDLPTLIWLANLADLELHTSLSRCKEPNRPTMMVFDLDPGPPAAILECARIALELRTMLDALGLESVPKTSGSKGIQVYVPLNVRVTYDDTKPFAHAIAKLLERQRPELVVSSMKKEIRGGKVLVDWSQNDDHKTTVCAYSLRARERPTASTPLLWEELEEALEARAAERLVFESEQVIERVEQHGDLFAQVLERRQKLPDLSRQPVSQK